MTMGEAVAKRIRDCLSERGITVYRLAQNACLPTSTVWNLFNGHTKSPTLTILFRICEGLEISVEEFLNCEYFQTENLDLD